ncbi:hypothetical protein IAU59_007246 [Kwoniella sp. CBS 9459]
MAATLNDAIIILGDSLTSRQEVPWNLHHHLSEAYRGKLDVLNRGYGGWNTAWIRQLFPMIFASKKEGRDKPAVRLVTIWLGTNDAALPGRKQHVPLSNFKDNMNHFLEGLTSPSSPYAVSQLPEALNIVLITPTIFSPLQWEADLPDKEKSRDLEVTRTYKDAVLELGREWKKKEQEQRDGKNGWRIETIDLWDAVVRANRGREAGPELERFFNDGLHLTTEGYEILWSRLSKVIKEDFHGRGLDWEDIEDLPFRAPRWEDIDETRPETVTERMALPACRRQ